MEWIALAVAGVALMIGGVGVWLALRHPPGDPPVSLQALQKQVTAQAKNIDWLLSRVSDLVAETERLRGIVDQYEQENRFLSAEAERLRTRLTNLGMRPHE